MNIAIVDDLPTEINNLKSILTDYSRTDGLTFEFEEYDSGEAFLENYEAFRYLVIFMDIYMGGMTGLDAARQIKEMDPDTPIVFLTTSLDHMGTAFSLHAYDYIAKPMDRERIFHMMDDLLRQHTTLYEKKLVFSADRQDYAMPLPDIVSIRTGSTNYLIITDKHGNEYHSRLTFSGICEELADEQEFLNINRGVLINLDYVSRIAENRCTLKNGTIYPVYTKKKGTEAELKWKNYVLNRVRKSQDARLKEL